MKEVTKLNFLRVETSKEMKLRIEKAIKNMANNNVTLSGNEFKKVSKRSSFIK